MSDRGIGRIISVDSFRVFIELDKDQKALHKSGYHGLYEIAKINSYIIIPVNGEKIVALITKIKVSDETEVEASSGTITLPKSKRYIIATMIGTIIENNGELEYLQGIYNYPILDNPVWYAMERDLEVIFDCNNKEIDYQKDYYLPIGTSAIFNDFEIKINPDNFFCKHSAILGNTGSGKSCTVSTILQSLLLHEFSENKRIKNANIIIFDTNGEYKSAFEFPEIEIKNRINPFVIKEEGIKIPFWFMNYDDFDYFFKPSLNTQTPIFKRAIEIAKNGRGDDSSSEKIDDYLYKGLQIIINSAPNELRKRTHSGDFGKYDSNNEIIQIAESFKINGFDEISSKLNLLGSNSDNEIEGINNQKTLINELRILLKKNTKEVKPVENNIDLPIHFNFKNLIEESIDQAIDEQRTGNSKITEYVSTLRLRLRSYLADERFNKPFLLDEENTQNLLSEFIQYLLGILSPNGDEDDIFSKYKSKYCQSSVNKNQITIIDMSYLSYEVLESVTGLIGRVILEFMSRLSKVGFERGAYPIIIVLEEAQNYIPEKNKDNSRVSISKKVFERIAREGRKFGISLIVSSQRPSELSKTVLSQCNTFIVHKLQNPEDQKYIKQVVSSATEDILNQLPVLPQQHAIIFGDAVRSPVQVKLRDVDPKPKSQNPKYIEQWIDEEKKITKEIIEKVVNNWIGIEKTENKE